MPTTATGRLSSAVSVSSGSSCVSCRRVLHLLSGRRVAQQAAVIGNWYNPNSSRNWLLEICCGSAAAVGSGRSCRQGSTGTGAGAGAVGVSSSFIRREPSAIAWGKKAVNMASQASKELLKVRSLHEDTDDPVVSTERLAKPVSYVPIPDIRGAVIALGKFDALHAGHRALAEQAAKMGAPVLLSFSGMAEVLGWQPRLPVAAFYDRKRIMSIWARHCGGVVPQECALEFVKVRSLSPREFVQKLSTDLCVKGVVAGANYRFGYRAAGDASDLVQLCSEYGLQSFIVDPVMDKDEAVCSMNGELAGNSREKGQISSTRVRKALSMGNMERVTNLLGRRHRLILKLDNSSKESDRLVIPINNAMNQFPGEGVYDCILVGAGEQVVATGGQDMGNNSADDLIGSAKVKIGPASIEIIMGDTDTAKMSQRRLLGVEF
ncbi:unnamed protein product [Calypogeia fissa]